jgi:hypothetical protein
MLIETENDTQALDNGVTARMWTSWLCAARNGSEQALIDRQTSTILGRRRPVLYTTHAEPEEGLSLPYVWT